eukprot:gene2031-5104_t
MFKVESVCRGARTGCFGAVKTPAAILHCRLGAPQHLQRDLLDKLPDPFIMHVPLSGIIPIPEARTIEQFGHNYSEFANLPGTVLFSAFDPGRSPPDKYNSELQVSLWTRNGRIKVDSTTYAEMAQSCRPDIAVPLSDVQSSHVTTKRQTRAIQRTKQHIDTFCASLPDKVSSIWLPVVGGTDISLREKSAKMVAEKASCYSEVTGFVLEGLCTGENRETRFQIIDAVMKNLPADKPRLVHSVSAIDEIIVAIEHGVDFFAESGKALSLDITSEKHPGSSTPLFLQLWSDEHQTDFRPLSAACTCYTCSTFTRAYIHHLLLTHEMLATILLTHFSGKFGSQLLMVIMKMYLRPSFTNMHQLVTNDKSLFDKGNNYRSY